MKNIIIVEDDKSMQAVYRVYFKDQTGKYNVEFADNGMVGYKKIHAIAYDLIVLDMVMKDMPGDSLFAVVDFDTKNKETPVIVISVLSRSDAGVEYILERKNTDYLKKPITKEQLFEKIKYMLTDKSGDK